MFDGHPQEILQIIKKSKLKLSSNNEIQVLVSSFGMVFNIHGKKQRQQQPYSHWKAMF